MDNWRIFLGGVASAGILSIGVAGPALAQAAPAMSSLPKATQDVSGSACSLAGLPNLGPVLSALAGALGAPCASAGTSSPAVGTDIKTIPGTTVPAGTAGPRADDGSVPGTPPLDSGSSTSGSGSVSDSLGGIAGALPGVSSLSGSLPGLGAVTGATSGLGGNSVSQNP